MKAARREDFGYIQIQSMRPQTIADSLTDAPVGHFPAMEAPQQLVGDIRTFFHELNSKA